MKKVIAALIIVTALFVIPAVATKGVFASTADAQPATDYNIAPANGHLPEGKGDLEYNGIDCLEST